MILLGGSLSSCQKQHIWEYNVSQACYADAFYILPDFKPRSFIINVDGTLNQDVVLVITGTQPSSDNLNQRFIGLNYHRKLSKGIVSFSDSVELYVDDLKIILSGSDTTLYPSPESKGTLHCLPLGEVKVKLTLN